MKDAMHADHDNDSDLFPDGEKTGEDRTQPDPRYIEASRPVFDGPAAEELMRIMRALAPDRGPIRGRRNERES